MSAMSECKHVFVRLVDRDGPYKRCRNCGDERDYPSIEGGLYAAFIERTGGS